MLVLVCIIYALTLILKLSLSSPDTYVFRNEKHRLLSFLKKKRGGNHQHLNEVSVSLFFCERKVLRLVFMVQFFVIAFETEPRGFWGG